MELTLETPLVFPAWLVAHSFPVFDSIKHFGLQFL